jgi:hypothetical protein
MQHDPGGEAVLSIPIEKGRCYLLFCVWCVSSALDVRTRDEKQKSIEIEGDWLAYLILLPKTSNWNRVLLVLLNRLQRASTESESITRIPLLDLRINYLESIVGLPVQRIDDRWHAECEDGAHHLPRLGVGLPPTL